MCKNKLKKEKKIQCICFFFCYLCFYHHIYESIAKWRLWRFTPSEDWIMDPPYFHMFNV